MKKTAVSPTPRRRNGGESARDGVHEYTSAPSTAGAQRVHTLTHLVHRVVKEVS
jgi:hypothetical protein|tara:strand:- start:2166 stop:2327 length:162 start_codon:yes stop_codon:yes gene_type:complete